MKDPYDEDKTNKKLKQPSRADLWNLRYKYYALYESLINKIPNGCVNGSYEYLKMLHRMDAEVEAYSKIIQDINKLLEI